MILAAIAFYFIVSVGIAVAAVGIDAVGKGRRSPKWGGVSALRYGEIGPCSAIIEVSTEVGFAMVIVDELWPLDLDF